MEYLEALGAVKGLAELSNYFVQILQVILHRDRWKGEMYNFFKFLEHFGALGYVESLVEFFNHFFRTLQVILHKNQYELDFWLIGPTVAVH